MNNTSLGGITSDLHRCDGVQMTTTGVMVCRWLLQVCWCSDDLHRCGVQMTTTGVLVFRRLTQVWSCADDYYRSVCVQMTYTGVLVSGWLIQVCRLMYRWWTICCLKKDQLSRWRTSRYPLPRLPSSSRSLQISSISPIQKQCKFFYVILYVAALHRILYFWTNIHRKLYML